MYYTVIMYPLVFLYLFFKKYKKTIAVIKVVLLIEIGLLLVKTIPFTFFKSQIFLCFVQLFYYLGGISFLVFVGLLIFDLSALVIFKLPNDFNELSFSYILAQILLLIDLIYSTWNIISKGKYTGQEFQAYITSFKILSPTLCVFVILVYQGICKHTLKIGLGSKSNKSIPLFYEMIFRTVLIAFTAWFTILVNNNPKDLFGGTLTFISTFATFLYPMLDMYKFTRTKLDEYEKEKSFEAVRKRQEETVRKRKEEIENESNGSKNYTV